MKKVHIVVLSDRRPEAVSDLEELGLVHVQEKPVMSKKIDDLRLQQTAYRKALATLASAEERAKKAGRKVGVTSGDESALQTILQHADDLKSLEDSNDKLIRETVRLQPWGNFDPKDFAALTEKNINIKLFILPVADIAKIAPTMRFVVCGRTKASALVAMFDDFSGIPLSAEAFVLPEMSLAQLEALILQNKQKISGIAQAIELLAGAKSTLESSLLKLEHQIEFHTVEAGMEDQGALAVIEGFLPVPELDALKNWAKVKGWGVAVQDPSPDDQVPTLLKNPKPVRLIKPVLAFLGTNPGYAERDISHWFLGFLTIFFAMIIGDAVYGLILLALGVFFGLKIKLSGKKLPEAIMLLIVFSLATITWGAMTGTWLAMPFEKLPFGAELQKLTVPFLLDPQNVKLLCFSMGMGHLMIAHFLRFMREVVQKPHIHAFAQLGWISVLFGAFWLVLNIVLDAAKYPVPEWAIYFIAGGMGAVFMFAEQKGQNFFKGILSSFANIIPTALSGVNAFADIISYIRLFAVGLAGFAIETSFNTMANGMFDSGGSGIIAGFLIMFAGHSLNLVMGALSVIVHGIRLNMLEFSGHIGLEWAGFGYKPFKKPV